MKKKYRTYFVLQIFSILYIHAGWGTDNPVVKDILIEKGLLTS